jgi:type VI secretion system protein ImpG
MADDFLSYYNRELIHVRRAAAEFAAQHPKIAGRLRLSADAIEDPHVGRLMEAFAFLTARIRQKLDDDFPELTDALLEILYPHYLAPIPSSCIVQFAPQPDLAGRYMIPAGVQFETDPVEDERCRFRTCYPVELWPIAIEAASLGGRPLVAPRNPQASDAVAVLRLSLSCTTPDASFDTLAPERLRFFLRGQPQQVYPLYELILNDTISIALADGVSDTSPVICGPESLRMVGLERDEGLLPYPEQSALGYRLLTEYFAFPEKFLFFDVAPPQGVRAAGKSRRLDVFFYLRRSMAALERGVSAENFALGCTPAVNLFSQRAEPITLDHTETEYRVVADARRPRAVEVYRVERVTATNAQGEERVFTPFYSIDHTDDDGDARAYWLARRRPAIGDNPGSEVYLSLVDLGFDPAQSSGWVLSTDTLCFNRNLPERLPFGGGHPRLTFVDGLPVVQSIHCLVAPTPTLRPTQGEGGRWRLVSHLALNHLSLGGPGEDGAEALREILSLYDFRDSSETRAVIQGITGLSYRPGLARAPGQRVGAFCRGIDLSIEFDEARFSGAGLYLLATVLERFFGLYCSINSFTRLTATVKGRHGTMRKWPPRAGEKTLL